MLQFEKESRLGSQNCQEVLLYWFGLVQGDLKLVKNVSQCYTLLIQSKLLTNAIPMKRKYRWQYRSKICNEGIRPT